MMSSSTTRGLMVLAALLSGSSIVSAQLRQHRCQRYNPSRDASSMAVVAFPATHASPRNSFLEPASAFPIAHGGAYQQNVQDLPGRTAPRAEIFHLGTEDGKQEDSPSNWRSAEAQGKHEMEKAKEHQEATGQAVPVPDWQLNFLASLNNLPITSLYDRTNRIFWSSTISDVVTVDRSSKAELEVVQKWRRQDWIENIEARAYAMLDSQGRYYVPAKLKLSTFSLANSSNPFSCIVEGPSLTFAALRAEILSRSSGALVMGESDGFRGLAMLYDGTIAFGTGEGWVGVVKLSSATNTFVEPWVIKLPGPDTTISNSISVDKYGGIYAVTATTMNRLLWNPTSRTPLSLSWSTQYAATAQQFGGRLGAGSGTTPAVFGNSVPATLAAKELFVTIADGEKVAKVLVFDAFNGKLVASRATDFGLSKAEGPNFEATTENSLTVFENRIFIERNVYQIYPAPYDFTYWPIVKGDKSYGLEQMLFTKPLRGLPGSLSQTWVRPDLSWPSAIPTLSSVDKVLYGVGRRTVTFDELVAQSGSVQKARRLASEFTGQVARTTQLLRRFGPVIANFFQQNGEQSRVDAPIEVERPRFRQSGDSMEAFTLDALDWLTGETISSVITGAGLRANPFFSGVTIGPDREVIYGGYFGWNRVN